MAATGDSPSPNMKLAETLHEALMAALLQREKDILQYLVILVTALGGFTWLLKNVNPEEQPAFVFGTVGVLLLLLLGAVYALALGYNFRYITLQLAKLERSLRIEGMMLIAWPRSPDDFARKYRLGVIPWCTPPEIIKVFWVAFLVAIVGVTTAACVFLHAKGQGYTWGLIAAGAGALAIAVLAPIHFGRKLRAVCKKEPLA